MKNNIVLTEYVFPIFGTVASLPGDRLRITPPQIFGTAFHLGKGLFVTAGHVIEASSKDGGPTLCVIKNDTPFFVPYQPDFIHIDETRDVGFMMFSKLYDVSSFSLGIIKDNSKATMGRNVQAIGYPFAFDITNQTIAVRLFKGHIVSITKEFNLSSKPFVYELSFQAPKGLSGAPVLLDDGIGVPETVLGIVTSTAIQIMTLPDKEEILSEGHSRTTVTYEYFLNLARALQINEIRDMEIKEIGKTIRAYLSD